MHRTLLIFFSLLIILSKNVIVLAKEKPKTFYRYSDIRHSRRPYEPFLKSIELDIYDGEYIFVIVGNPGRYVKLRLNFQIDRILMYTDLSQISQTYAMIDQKKTLGSDIFYIGKYKLRFPVVTDVQQTRTIVKNSFNDEKDEKRETDSETENDERQNQQELLMEARRIFDDIRDDDDDHEEYEDLNGKTQADNYPFNSQIKNDDFVIDDDDTDSSSIYSNYVTSVLGKYDHMQADNPSVFIGDIKNEYISRSLIEGIVTDGEFALGPGSSIWRYWSNFTMCIDSITLGAYNIYNQRDVHYRGPIIPILFYYPLWTPDTMFKHRHKDSYGLTSENPWSYASEKKKKDRLKTQQSLVNEILKFEKTKSFFEDHNRKDRLKLIEHILSIRYRKIGSHNYIPRGSFVVLGKILGKVYKIILNYESYSTYIPHNLKKKEGFQIEFGNIQALLDELKQSASVTNENSHRNFAKRWANSNGKQKQELYDMFISHLMTEEHIDDKVQDGNARTHAGNTNPVVNVLRGSPSTRDEFLDFHDNNRGLSVYKNSNRGEDSPPGYFWKCGDDSPEKCTFNSRIDPNATSSTLKSFMSKYWKVFGERLYKHGEQLPQPVQSTCIDEYIDIGIDIEKLGSIPKPDRVKYSEDPKYCTNTTTIHFSISDHRILLKNDFEYHVVFESPIDNVIMLGKHTLRHLVTFVDLKDLKLVVSPSYHYFITSGTVYYICMTMAILLSSWWLIAANAESIYYIGSEQEKITALSIITTMQILSSVFCIVSSVILVKGYEVYRLFSHLVRTDYAVIQVNVIFIFITLLSFSNVFLNTISLIRILQHQKYVGKRMGNVTENQKKNLSERKEKNTRVYLSSLSKKQKAPGEQVHAFRQIETHELPTKNPNAQRKTVPVFVYKPSFIVYRWLSTIIIRRFQTEIPALIVIWFCLVKHHQTIVDIAYLVCISTALTMSSTFIAFEAYFHRKSYRHVIMLGCVFSYMFLYFYNLLPAISVIWGIHNPYRYSLSIVFVVSIVFAPSAYFYSMYQKKILVNQPYKEDIMKPVYI